MLRYNGTTIGRIVIKQTHNDTEYRYNLQIRQGNCLAVVIYVRKSTPEELEKNPEGKWYHNLYTFFADEQHLKNLLKEYGDIFCGERIIDVRLNLYYKECNKLLKYIVKSGHQVRCYYEEPKNK